MANLRSTQEILNRVFDNEDSTLNVDANLNLSGVTLNISTAGLATSARQDTGNASLTNIESQTVGLATSSKQDIIIGKLTYQILSGIALPSGAATFGAQTTGNSSLATIESQTAGLATLSRQNVIINKLDQEILSGIVVIPHVNSFTSLISGTSDGQGLSALGSLRLMGFSATETASSSAPAQIVLHHGTSNAGSIITYIKLAASESVRDMFGDGIAVTNGVFVEKPIGNSQLTLIHRTEA